MVGDLNTARNNLHATASPKGPLMRARTTRETVVEITALETVRDPRGNEPDRDPDCGVENAQDRLLPGFVRAYRRHNKHDR